MVSGLIGNEVPRKGLRVRAPCPPLYCFFGNDPPIFSDLLENGGLSIYEMRTFGKSVIQEYLVKRRLDH